MEIKAGDEVIVINPKSALLGNVYEVSKVYGDYIMVGSNKLVFNKMEVERVSER